MQKSRGAEKSRYSMQIKFSSAFGVVIIALLALLNTYPIIVSINLTFNSKHTSLYNQAYVMSSSLSPLEVLSEDGVRQAMELLDVMPLQRVVITDGAGKILYDTSDAGSAVGYYAFFAEIYGALMGDEVFFSSFKTNAFLSHMALPVMSRSDTIGAVYLSEYDTEQAQLIGDMREMLRNISIGVGLLSLVITLIFTRAMTKRIKEMVQAVHIIRDGQYDYRLKLTGRDELTELGNEFNNLTARLQKTEEVRRRFVSDASHELRTPLAAIRLLSDSIAQADGMDGETVREFASDITSEAERLQRTAEKLLSLTRLDREEELNRISVDLSIVAGRTLKLLEPLAREYGISLTHELEEGCRILASEDDMYEVVFNLAENAIKYNLPGGSVTLTVYALGSYIYLNVDDTGIGIPEEDVPNVFSRFYRVDKARSREHGGSGLGLSIVHGAVTAYGGIVEILPNYPRGTRFAVRFPAYTATGGDGGET